MLSAEWTPLTREDRAVACPLFLLKLLIRLRIARFLPGIQRLTEGETTCLPYLSDRMLQAPLPDLRDLAGWLESSSPDLLDLTTGTPRLDLVPSLSTHLPPERRGWPPIAGQPELRQSIARRLQEQHGLALRPDEEVHVTAGAAGGLQQILETFTNPDDAVALCSPTSPLHLLAARQQGLRVRWLPTWTEQGRIRFRLEDLPRALRGVRLLILASPANPTGGVFHPVELEQLAWWADRRDVLLAQDAAFEAFSYEGPPATLATIPRSRRRTLIVGSVSKSHGLTAARVGWLAGPRALIRPCLLNSLLRTAFVPTLCQQLAVAALKQRAETLQPVREAFAARRRYAFERLQNLGLKPAWPAGGFFLWVDVQESGLTGRVFAEQLLRSKGVLVTPGEFFGPGGESHIRLSYAAEEGRLHEGLARLADFVRGTREQKNAA